MNILHVTPYLAPAWAYGRVPHIVADIARAQARLGHTVSVLTTDALAPHERLPRGETTSDGVLIVRVPNLTSAIRTWLDLSTPIGLGRAAHAIFARQTIDVVHLHELRTVENLRVTALCPAATARVVSPHGTVQKQTGRSWARRMWDLTVGDRNLRAADQWLVRSDEEAAEVRALFDTRGLPLRPEQISLAVDDTTDVYERARERAAART